MLEKIEKIGKVLGQVPNDVHAAFIMVCAMVLALTGHQDLARDAMMGALAIFRGTGGKD